MTSCAFDANMRSPTPQDVLATQGTSTLQAAGKDFTSVIEKGAEQEAWRQRRAVNLSWYQRFSCF